MRKWLIVTLAIAAAGLLALMPATAQADITNSVHDFTGTGPNANFQNAPGECVTCHTPHRAQASRLIWNHTLSGQDWAWSDEDTTLAGTSLADGSVDTSPGTSKFCLSCHDGTIAVGDVSAQVDWGSTKITGNKVVTTNSGLDLAGNHPIAIPYPSSPAAYNSITTAISTVGTDWVAIASIDGGTGVKLFTDGTGRGIECASCHDPHGTANTYLLRATRATFCSECHLK